MPCHALIMCGNVSVAALKSHKKRVKIVNQFERKGWMWGILHVRGTKWGKTSAQGVGVAGEGGCGGFRLIRIWDTARDHTLRNIYRFFANDEWAVRPRLLHDRGKMWAKMGINLLGRMCVYYEYKKGFLMANSKETAPTDWIGVWYIIFEMTGYSTYIHGMRGYVLHFVQFPELIFHHL